MPYPNEHAARLNEPSQYDSIRRENDKFGPGIHAIWGVKDGKAELQAIRFDKAKFTPAEAEKWLKEHKHEDCTFEPASNAAKQADEAAIPFADGEGAMFADEAGDTGWVEVFRAGAYPQATVKAEEVSQVASGYSPARYEAPVSLDHKDDGPAFGWVQAAKAVADRLFVRFRGLVPAFREAAQRFYPRRSVELYPPDHNGNPTPGQWALKAVSFLGVKAPQVKGLEPLPASFAGAGGTNLDFQEWKPMSDDKKPVQADETKFNELQAKVARLDEEKKASDAAAVKLAEELAAERRTRVLAEEKAFCDGLTKEGKLAPVAGIAELLVALRELPTEQTVTFAEADGKEAKKRPYEVLRAHLAGLKKVVELDEVAGDETDEPAPGRIRGKDVIDAELNEKALAYQAEREKAGEHIRFADALKAVAKS